jgi:hypothetical protein
MQLQPSQVTYTKVLWQQFPGLKAAGKIIVLAHNSCANHPGSVVGSGRELLNPEGVTCTIP